MLIIHIHILLLDDKTLGLSKLKIICRQQKHVMQNMKFILEWLEDPVERETLKISIPSFPNNEFFFYLLKNASCQSLTPNQTTNFGLFQTERVCRWQFLNVMKMVQSSPNG